MNMFSRISEWDVVLVIAVSVIGTFAAQIRQAHLKSLLLVIPIPFTLAFLALGQPIDVTHITGLFTLLIYTFIVKLLHKNLHVPIVFAIIISAISYCVLAVGFVGIMPKNDNAFLLTAVGVCVLGSVLHSSLPHISEPNHHSSMPAGLKFILIMCVMIILVFIKMRLQGFMTVFPMLGVFIAYESRHSLYTVFRHIPIAMLTIAPMMVVIWVLQAYVGSGWALAGGWVAYLLIMPAFVLPMRKEKRLRETMPR